MVMVVVVVVCSGDGGGGGGVHKYTVHKPVPLCRGF